MASEGDKGQTIQTLSDGVVGILIIHTSVDSRIILEYLTIGSESLVSEIESVAKNLLSTARHVKPGGNLGGPSSKPKYYLVTDSEQVP